MTRDVQACASGDEASSIMLRMTPWPIRHMPAVQYSRLVDLVSPGDLVKQRLSKLGSAEKKKGPPWFAPAAQV